MSSDDPFTGFLDNILVDFPPQTDDLSFTRKPNTTSSGSDTNKWELIPTEERKRKRMISNRESARRSRLRKQKRLEDLTKQVTQYETANQELVKRLWLLNHNGLVIRHENKRLRLESARLEQRLTKLRQLLTNPELIGSLLSSAWPCNNNVTINEQNQPTLITF